MPSVILIWKCKIHGSRRQRSVLNAVADQLALFKGKYVTSDHRVAGSSPAGCRSSLVADLQAIKHPKNKEQKILLSGFSILLDSVSSCMRINPRNLLACRIRGFRYNPGHSEAHPSQRRGYRPIRRAGRPCARKVSQRVSCKSSWSPGSRVLVQLFCDLATRPRCGTRLANCLQGRQT